MNTRIKLFLSTALLFSLFALSGCNTFKGMGEDIESLGESMQKAD